MWILYLLANRPNTWRSIFPAPNALTKSTPQFRRVNSIKAVYVSSFSLKKFVGHQRSNIKKRTWIEIWLEIRLVSKLFHHSLNTLGFWVILTSFCTGCLWNYLDTKKLQDNPSYKNYLPYSNLQGFICDQSGKITVLIQYRLYYIVYES